MDRDRLREKLAQAEQAQDPSESMGQNHWVLQGGNY